LPAGGLVRLLVRLIGRGDCHRRFLLDYEGGVNAGTTGDGGRRGN
jgi:hypothetical protein